MKRWGVLLSDTCVMSVSDYHIKDVFPDPQRADRRDLYSSRLGNGGSYQALQTLFHASISIINLFLITEVTS